MAAKIVVTLTPAQYATLKRELDEAREAKDEIRKNRESLTPKERADLGKRIIELDLLIKEV
jgi:hypothetical protein